MNSEVKCLVCKVNSTLMYNLDRNKIINGLSSLMHTLFPENTVTSDYSIYRCNNCTLEFAHPCIPGNDAFYTLLASQPHYYTHDRPEYAIVKKLILESTLPVRVLDVGCGDGSFLEKLKSINGVDAIGLDTTQKSIDACLEKGLNALCLPIQEYQEKDFDFIVAFHCLEHIPNPISFMKAMANRLKPNGTLIIATPYSPISYEALWYHPLNNPPHHMLRLNEKSYRQLGKELGLKVELINFCSTSFKSRVRTSLTQKLYDDNIQLSPFKFLGLILINPISFLKIVNIQLNRDKVNGTVAGDDILVLFKQ